MFKKFFAAIMAICFVAAFSACGNKSSKTEDLEGYSVVSTDANGVSLLKLNSDPTVLGLKYGDKLMVDPTRPIVKYHKIEYDKDLNGYRLYEDANSQRFTFADSTGYVMRDGLYDKVTRDESGKFYYLTDEIGVAIYSTEAKRSWGAYDEVSHDKTFIFGRRGKTWSIRSFNDSLDIEKEFLNIYVINYKSESDYAVAANDNGEWSLYDQEGAQYSASSAEIKRLIRSKKTKSPVGVLDIKF